ncbi:MAG: hypothetical protein RIQ79_1907 [Verrucomicrobiota bacterium]
MTTKSVSSQVVYFLGWILVLLTAPLAASAHDIKEMSINARVHADRIELRVVTSNHMASALLALGTEGQAAALDAETFASLRPRLETRGKELLSLWTGGKTARELPVTAIDVLLGQQNEIEFFLTYAPATDGALRIDAKVLDQIENGYVVTLLVFDAKRTQIGAKAMKRGDSSLTVPLAGNAREQAAK